MANKDLVEAIEKNLVNLYDDDFKVFSYSGGTIQPWQNQTAEEISFLIEDTISILKKSMEENLLIGIPFNLLNAINTQLNNFYTQYIAIKSLQENQLQNQHHNPLNQLQATNQQLRTAGVYTLAILGPDIEGKRISIDEQLSKVSQANADIVKLQEQIKSLINPAAADSLSSAFDSRRQKISIQKWVWAFIVACSVGIAMYATHDITNSISDLVTEISRAKEEPINTDKIIDKDSKKDIKNSINKAVVDPNDIPLVWFMRVLLLAPSYFLVFFSFRQYVHERMLEENYAHKSAIAQTLPSYSELVTNASVRDEITASATRVAFELPRVNDNKNSSNFVHKKLDELTNKIEKIVNFNEKS